MRQHARTMNDRLESILSIVLSSLMGVAGQTCAKIGLARLGLDQAFRLRDSAKLFASPLVWTGGALLVAGTLVWFHALSKIEFSIAMPVSALLMLVFSVVAGIVCFGESIPSIRAAGLGLALVAVWLISR
jgi:drug/metabolite transporter (DMT)-like permease